jgi:hypothetical protein
MTTANTNPLNSAASLSRAIGQEALLRADGGLWVSVLITDAKLSYGNVRYLVTPVRGSGTVWVDSSRIQIMEEN